MNRTPGRSLIAAGLAFTIALVLFASSLVRALQADGAAPSALAPPGGSDVASSPADRPLTMDALMLAVENDPFQPDRTRPAERYRMPGDVEPEAPPPAPPPPALPDFRLNGTVVTQAGGMALIQVGDAPGRMVTMNESLLGYRLTEVTTQSATLANDERDIVLRVPSPARVAQTESADGRSSRRTGRQTPQEARESAAIQQLLQRARASGAGPEMLEALRRAAEQRARSGGDEDGVVEFRANRIEFAAPPPPARRVPPPTRRDSLDARDPHAPELR